MSGPSGNGNIFGRLRVLMPYIVPKDGKQLCQLINNQKKRQQTELERLREENELLQIENEYLKKIKSLSPGRRKQQAQVIQELKA